MNEVNIKVERIEHHRNGVSGNPFYVVLFREAHRRGRVKRGSPLYVGIVFPTVCNVAVLDVARLAAGRIGGVAATDDDHNAHRAEVYEGPLRRAIEAQSTSLSALVVRS